MRPLLDLPGWELRSGGNCLRGRWRFRQPHPAAVFAWVVMMRCLRHGLFPNLIVWRSAVTVEISELNKPGRMEQAKGLAADLSTINGPPRPQPIERASALLEDFQRALRAEMIVQRLKEYLDARH